MKKKLNKNHLWMLSIIFWFFLPFVLLTWCKIFCFFVHKFLYENRAIFRGKTFIKVFDFKVDLLQTNMYIDLRGRIVNFPFLCKKIKLGWQAAAIRILDGKVSFYLDVFVPLCYLEIKGWRKKYRVKGRWKKYGITKVIMKRERRLCKENKE